MKLPVIDMIEIGSGGGSLARVDERGLIRVGPRSAGADPGPACYAKGGTRPTLTDADVVLGYLDPGFFLGGEMRLDADAARAAIEEHVAKPAGTRPDPRGVGRARDRERGRGAGVPHPRFGTRIRLPEIVDGRVRRLGPGARTRDRPQAPHPPRHLSHRGRGDVGARAAGEPARFRDRAFSTGACRRPRRRDRSKAFIAPLVAEASEFLHRAGIEDPRITTRLDMRYQGQGHEIEVTLPDNGARNADRYRRRRRQRCRLHRRVRPPRRAVPGQVRRDLLGDVPRRAPGDRELEGGGGGRGSGARLRRHRGRGPRAREALPATSGSATPSSSAKSSTATRSSRGRSSRVPPSSRSASPPACSAPATGARWTRT